jgi:hypothetical protein
MTNPGGVECCLPPLQGFDVFGSGNSWVGGPGPWISPAANDIQTIYPDKISRPMIKSRVGSYGNYFTTSRAGEMGL